MNKKIKNKIARILWYFWKNHCILNSGKGVLPNALPWIEIEIFGVVMGRINLNGKVDLYDN